MNNNPFYQVTVNNRSSASIEFEMVPDEGPIPDQTPVKLPNGKFKIPMIQPRDDARHVALGKFMDQWSKLEMQIARLLGIAMGRNSLEMPAVMNALGTKGQRECLEALLVPNLEDEPSRELQRLLALLKSNATKRNYLAHGFWSLEVIIADRNGVPWPNYRQYRRYNPSDPHLRKALSDRSDPKARKTYMFSIARINAIAAELDRLWHAFSKIRADNLKQPPQKPIHVKLTDGVSRLGFSAQPITNNPTKGS
jgi:hypothetical protein